MKKWKAVVLALAFMAVAIWSYNIGSINYMLVNAQSCKE